MKLPFALWSSTTIRSLIADLLGIEMARVQSVPTCSAGDTPLQKAAKRAYERSDKATQEWLDHTPAHLSRSALKYSVARYSGVMSRVLAISVNTPEVMHQKGKRRY